MAREAMTAASPSANALHHPKFVFYWFATWATSFAVQIMSVSVGWQIYDITRDPLDLGLVGLAQFMPPLLMVLFTGLAADKFNRRLIMGSCLLVEIGCAVALVLFTLAKPSVVWPVFIILVVLGFARAFYNPASDALAPNLVPQVAIAHGISLNSMSWQVANIAGPVAGGLLYGISGEAAYGAAAALVVLAMALIALIGAVPQSNHAGETSLGTLLAGFKFIRKEKIVLGAISLDLFAVLLGGAVALMPVYARDILHVGELGLGLLRAAPGIGAIIAIGLITAFPIRDHAGWVLLVTVVLFGLATAVFGASTLAWLSILALMCVGGFDMVSVYVREIILQLWTPDAVRGRVNAVNSIFVGASNELGEARAGFMAAFAGPVFTVVAGGFAAVGIAAASVYIFPEMRRIRTLDDKRVPEAAVP
jgi:MFS family permease